VYRKVKIIGGYFYHFKTKSEKIEKIEVDGHELLASNPKFEEEDEASDLSGKEVSVIIDGKTYTAVVK